jgi:hypothetical protein
MKTNSHNREAVAESVAHRNLMSQTAKCRLTIRTRLEKSVGSFVTVATWLLNGLKTIPNGAKRLAFT